MFTLRDRRTCFASPKKQNNTCKIASAILGVEAAFATASGAGAEAAVASPGADRLAVGVASGTLGTQCCSEGRARGEGIPPDDALGDT
jgi:hypothetical protein